MEMMLALVLFAVGTLGVMSVMHQAQRGAADGEDSLVGLQLAQKRLAELANVTYASLADEAKARLTGSYSEFCREVAVTTPYTNLRQVVVTVTWDPPDCAVNTNANNVVLQTYRSAI
jgi:Tfp pilus assembly protein PilV